VTFNEFLIEVTKRTYKNRYERYGQALYNTLHDIRPEIAEKISGTEFDPFYMTSGMRVDRCVQEIERRW